MPKTLTQATLITCAHGGAVIAVPTSRVRAAGSKVLTTADEYTVAGCTNQNASGDPSPCTTVEWIATDGRTKASRAATLSMDSAATCKAETGAPQGAAIIVATQPRMAST